MDLVTPQFFRSFFRGAQEGSDTSAKSGQPPPSDQFGWFQDHGTDPRLDEHPIAAMRAALKGGASERAMLTDWIEGILADQSSGVPLTVLGHSALTFLLRRGTFKGDPEVLTKIEQALSASWRNFTGAECPEGQLIERLPRRVLSGAGREGRAFHAAVFQSDHPKNAQAELALGKDYVPEKQDAGYVLLLLAALTTEAGLELLGGGAIGTAIASYLESFLHDHGAHATKKTRDWANADGIKGYLGRRVTETHYSHTTIHHAKTYRRDHVTQFASAEEQAQVDQILKARGPRGDEIIEERYGVTVKNENILPYLQPYVVSAIAVAVGLHLSPLAVVGMMLPILAPPMASKHMHPYMHMKREDAMKQASAPMRLLLGSRYAELISRLHFGHHRGRGGNFNLLPPVGDLVRGQLRKPNVKQLIAMRDIDMIR